ncbi:MAG: hypothetical protein ACU841_00680 [Gammaproteobacteria bacterium]
MLSIQQIESEWALIYYQTPEKKQEEAYQRLLVKAIELEKQFPNRAEPLFWQAVLKSNRAAHQDALDALNSIKEARNLLLKAIHIDPKTMDGSAYVTLGTLYYMVPKWPIAFGDNEKAKDLLKTALTINPDGIDTNYFFGEYLLTTGKYGEAVRYLEKAANAPARKEQLFADNQLKTEARIALKKAINRQQAKGNTLFVSLLNSAGLE